MPAILDQIIKLKDGTVLQPSDITVSSIVNWSCSSGRCAARHGKKTELTWDETEAEKSPESLPDGFWRFIRLSYDPLDQNKAVDFCSAQCAKDWLVYEYQVPKTARQIMQETRAKAKDAAQLELPFDEPPINPISAAAPLQDTGDPWNGGAN